jgi:hypothetical protein
MSDSQDDSLTHLLERLEAFEERAGVRLEALYATAEHSTGWTINGKWVSAGIQVNGELHPRDGTSLGQIVTVKADAYDKLGRLVGTAKDYFNPKQFFGYQTFSMRVGEVPFHQISKIRIYPIRVGV